MKEKLFFEISFILGIHYREVPISAKDIIMESMFYLPKDLYEIYYCFKKGYGIGVSLKTVSSKVKYLYKKGYLDICFPPSDYTKKLTDKQVKNAWFELSEKGIKYCIKKNLIE